MGLAERQRRTSDTALRLACAVTGRIETSSGFHWGDLQDKIRERLDFSEARRNLPADTVRARAMEIARKRAEADIRVGAARETRGAPVHGFRARFEGDARFSARHRQDRYRALVDDGLRWLEREGVRPTGLELAAARVEVTTGGTRYEATGRDMAEALEFGSVAGAEDIRAERAALPTELVKPVGDLGTFGRVRLLERVFRSCTVSEIRDMSAGKGPLSAGLPDGAARSRAAENLRILLSTDVVGPAPWKKAQAVLARSLLPERARPYGTHDRSRDIGVERS